MAVFHPTILFYNPFLVSLVLLVLFLPNLHITDAQVGVCYGGLGNNLPSDQEVVNLYKSNGIRRMRSYYPVPQALQALRGSNIELILDVPNSDLKRLANDAPAAAKWVQDNVLNYYPDVKFRIISVGNEVNPNSGETARLAPFVLLAMSKIYDAIASAGLKDQIKVLYLISLRNEGAMIMEREMRERERGRSGDGFEQRKSTVFVDNLPNGIRKGFIHNFFSRFGRIWDCFIPNKRSKSTGQSFGFVRFESSRDALQAVRSTHGSWIWGQVLMVNMAKFSKKLEGRPNQFYNRFNEENLEDGEAYRNQGRYITQRPSQTYNQYDQETLEDGELRNQGRYDYQFSNFIPVANINNSSSKGNQLGIYQKKSQIQKNSLPLKIIEERGKEVWRRKGFPESSKQGGYSRVSNQEKEGKDEGITINVQAVGNGWLNRSAVGKIKRLISAQELESLFKKGLARNVQIKPMGGRFVIITFLSEDQRNETLKEKWLELWFDEVKPWNGESSKSERFAWIACYGMPLNAWNVQTFRAIGSLWGCFIELDSDTLREVSFAKGRILIATENPNKIEGKVQLLVDRRKYTVRMEEEESFRTVISSNQVVPNCAANSEPEEGDDEMDNMDGDVDASKKNKDNSVDDMEKQRNKESDDRAKNNDEVAGKYENNGLNGSHQVENCNEESSNSAHGLDSIVQDSQSPMNDEYVESANNRCHVHSVEVGVDDKHEQEKDCRTEDNNPVQCDSNITVRASQVHGINLLVDLNPSVVRRNVRSQQLEVSLNSEGDEIDEYIIASQEQEQIEIDKEVQNTIKAGNTLGIKFGDSGIKRMTKLIEEEAKILKASLKNNSFAPLMRDE